MCFPSSIQDNAYWFKFPVIYKKLNFGKQSSNELEDNSVEFTGKQFVILNGWNVYEFKREFARQGVDKTWTVFDTVTCWNNKDILWDTYPQRVYIPYSIKSNNYAILVILYLISIEMCKF